MKSLLLHIQDDTGLESRLQAALALARAHNSHLTCLHVTPISLYMVADGTAGVYMMPNFIENLDLMEKKVRARVERHLANEDVSWDYNHMEGEPAQVLVSRSALFDLIILGRSNHRETRYTPLTLIGDVLEAAGTPIWVQPEMQHIVDPLGPALVAWNGSFEAANAIRAALPLLQKAAAVHIVTVEEPEDHVLPALDASIYLSRHGVESDLHARSSLDMPVDRAIMDVITETNASYVIMGGYGHSRAREYLFGGVTRSLLKDCPVPMVLAH
jgi:nucleotide-binding universal stress UspA family protein